MLHILFLILKIIGILLLVVLGLILSVLAVVLLIPVRYRVSAEKGSKIQAEGSLSWLMGMIRIQAGYDGGQTGIDLFLFGRSLLNRNPKKQKPGKRRKKRASEQPRKTEQPQEIKAECLRETESEQPQEDQYVPAIPVLLEKTDQSENSVDMNEQPDLRE